MIDSPVLLHLEVGIANSAVSVRNVEHPIAAQVRLRVGERRLLQYQAAKKEDGPQRYLPNNR